MTPSSATVLVTGGAGYVGSHVCKALQRAGYRPIVYDNLCAGHEWAAKWGPLELGDIQDRARLDEIINKYHPKAVMHFAAFAYIGESVTDPGKYYRNNVTGSLTLLETMRDHKIERIVFSSTCATYGVPENIPIGEDAPQRPINPYGASKLMVERMIEDFGSAYGLRSVALRYFNAAGADPEGDIGEDHDPETHLIPLVLDVASRRRPNVTVFGSDYPTPDGTCVRDYIHVADLADAHVKSLQALEGGLRSGAYNLGIERGFSVREVVDTACRVTDREIPVVLGKRRTGDPAALVSNAVKARNDLGWRPKIVDLTEIIRTAWAWHHLQRASASQPKYVINA
jgi:UDP-arabinose 4-epimerase